MLLHGRSRLPPLRNLAADAVSSIPTSARHQVRRPPTSTSSWLVDTDVPSGVADAQALPATTTGEGAAALKIVRWLMAAVVLHQFVEMEVTMDGDVVEMAGGATPALAVEETPGTQQAAKE